MLGSRHAWVASEMRGEEQMDALWKTYPRELLSTLFFEISQIAAEDPNGLGGRYGVPPVWSKEGTRVGRYVKLDKIADDATGFQKLNAFLSGMSTGACHANMRGWRHWAQYCRLRGQDPWISVGEAGWGEMILDFIMFEHSATGIKPPTTTGKLSAVRYFHVIHGRSDFTVGGVRYKLLLKFPTKRMPSVRKLPYNVDFLQWAYWNFVSKGIRARKTWGSGTESIWVFFFFRASKIKHMSQKDVEIGVGAERGN